MALNVPVVYDVFAARMSETVGFAGLQKCGGDKTARRALARLRFFVA
jgi:hypothetical protein